MKIKTSKLMAKELSKEFKEEDFEITKVTCNYNEYKWYVNCDLFVQEMDYNPKTGKFDAIQIRYPEEYYAPDKYLTTYDLIQMFRKSDGTWDSFAHNVKEAILI